MNLKRSPIWNYFVALNDSTAKCNLCEKVYSRKGRTTTALKSHLKSMHYEKFKEFKQADEETKQSFTPKQNVSTPIIVDVKTEITLQPSPNKQLLSTYIQEINKSNSNNCLWDSLHQKSQEMDRAIAEMIALQNLPLNFVEGSGFRRVINTALPQYQLKGCKFFASFICDELYHKVAKKIKGVLEQFEKITFTTEIYSDINSSISLLSLTAHGITTDFRKISLTLKSEVIEGSQTCNEISSKFQSLLQEWSINPKAVHCMVSDRGSNMIRAMNLAGFESINCTVQQLQYCMRVGIDSQEWLVQLIAKLKTIVKHFHQSIDAQAELAKIRTEILNQPALSIDVQDFPTRGTSTYNLLERFLKTKDGLELYLNSNQIAAMSPEDWIIIEKCVKILKPFEEITRDLSSSQISISSVIPLVHVLTTTLQREAQPGTSEQIRNLIQKLTDELNSSTRFGELIKNNLYTIATYLDPRYKTKFFNEIVKELVESEILRLIAFRSELKDPCSPPSPKKRREQASTSTNTSYDLLESMLSTDEQDNKQHVILKSILQEYNRERRLPLQEDPLVWWKMNASKYHVLVPIVRQFLCVPPSNVEKVKLLRDVKIIDEENENKLQDDIVSKVLFVKHNIHLLNG